MIPDPCPPVRIKAFRTGCVALLTCGFIACDSPSPPAAETTPTAVVDSKPKTQTAAPGTPTQIQTPPRTTPAPGTGRPLQNPSLPAGNYTVKGPLRIQLANPGVRFADKNPHAAPGQRMDKLTRVERALEASSWEIGHDGSVRVSWTDPNVQRAIGMTGRWQPLFGQFTIEVKNPEARIVTDDGAPNAPLALECTARPRPDSDILRLSVCQFFYATPDHQRLVGQTGFELVPK